MCVCGDVIAEIKEAANDVENAGLSLFKARRSQRLEALAAHSTVVEIQVDFPGDVTGAGDESAAFETVIILLQLLCQEKGWKHAVLGRWPAKVYLVLTLPGTPDANVTTFLATLLPEALTRACVPGWVYPDGIVGDAQLSVRRRPPDDCFFPCTCCIGRGR